MAGDYQMIQKHYTAKAVERQEMKEKIREIALSAYYLLGGLLICAVLWLFASLFVAVLGGAR